MEDIDKTESLDIGYWEVTASSGELYWSDEVYKIHGLKPGTEMNVESAINAYHPDDRAKVEEYVRKALQEKENFQFVLRLLKNDEIIRYVSCVGFAHVQQNGDVSAVFGTFEDITEQRRDELQFEQAQSDLIEAQRLAQVGSWELDLVTNTLVWSEEIYRIFEINPKAFAASYEAFLEAIHPDDREMVNNAYLNSLETRQKYKISHRLQFPDGRIKWVEERCETEFDGEGEPVLSRGTVQDISDLKKARAKAEVLRVRVEEILAIAPEAVITIGNDMRIQLFNQGAERIFGYSPSEIIGESMDVLMPEYLRQSHGLHIQKFNHSPDTYLFMDQRSDILGLRKDGTEFPASASVSKLEIDGERVYTVILRDVTKRRRGDEERRNALTEAEKANRAKSDFLAAMSHELRTPLNAILGFSDILTHEYLGPIENKKYVEYAQDIHSSGKHLLSLVNDILDISSIEAGKMPLNKETLSIKSIIDESINLVSINAKARNIMLTTEMPIDILPMIADRKSIKQILLNLLGNAIKFTPEGGNITLSVDRVKQDICIKIVDTGPGIPNDNLPELTNPFTRLEQDPHKPVEGWGLGLAITKSLINLHDGKLDIESELGKGTTVTVTLPILVE